MDNKAKVLAMIMFIEGNDFGDWKTEPEDRELVRKALEVLYDVSEENSMEYKKVINEQILEDIQKVYDQIKEDVRKIVGE